MPLPNTFTEALEAVWEFLKTRLQERQAQGVALGVPHPRRVSMPRSNRTPMDQLWHGDLRTGRDGQLLVGALIPLWPDDLSDAQRRACPLVLDAVAEFIRTGIIRPSRDTDDYYITQPGAAAIAADSIGPSVVGDGRVDAFVTEFAGCPDFDIFRAYLTESVGTYRANLDLACAVTIGAAYELALLQVVDGINAFAGRGGNLGGLNAAQQNALQAHANGGYVSASRLEQAAHQVLSNLGAQLSFDLRQWIEGSFRPGFLIVRTIRNAAGHPTGLALNREELGANIVWFTSTYRRCRHLDAELAALP